MRVWCSRQHSGLPSRYRGFDPRHALHRRRFQPADPPFHAERPGERCDGTCADKTGVDRSQPCPYGGREHLE